MNNHTSTDEDKIQSNAMEATEHGISLANSEQARRDAIGKIGRYSAYLAPVMLAMFSKQVQAGS